MFTFEFTFEDGGLLWLESESDCWAAKQQKRYEVEELNRVREILNDLIGNVE